MNSLKRQYWFSGLKGRVCQLRPSRRGMARTALSGPNFRAPAPSPGLAAWADRNGLSGRESIPGMRVSSRIVVHLVRGLLIAGLLASMLFAHGCHGDEDNELFSACVEWLGK
ncbi:MAG: hypothetical protein HY289_05510 [Planctomycetes bacterium]|nr:hypothetical protein [Planctomycetota bacterium]